MAKEKILTQRYVYEGQKIKLRVDEVSYPSGNTAERAVIEHRGAVAIVALDETNAIYLVRQPRPATGKILLEIPAGTREVGEEPLVTAERELQEEIGFRASSMTLLAEFYTAPGFCNEYMYLYLAQDLAPSRLPAPEDEEISVVKLTFDEARTAIARKEIVDAKSIIGLLLAGQMLFSQEQKDE